MWVKDITGVSLGGDIANGTIIASCGGVPMVKGTANYFTMTTTCAGTISIFNTYTYGVIYT